MKVFIGGSIGINYLDYTVTDELNKYMQGDLEILIGDAYGIDSLVQKYLAEYSYDNVTVYASNGRARNNISGWKVKAIEVPSYIHGREFYTQKDIAMTNDCDFAFMIWNGKSQGKTTELRFCPLWRTYPTRPKASCWNRSSKGLRIQMVIIILSNHSRFCSIAQLFNMIITKLPAVYYHREFAF